MSEDGFNLNDFLKNMAESDDPVLTGKEPQIEIDGTKFYVLSYIYPRKHPAAVVFLMDKEAYVKFRKEKLEKPDFKDYFNTSYYASHTAFLASVAPMNHVEGVGVQFQFDNDPEYLDGELKQTLDRYGFDTQSPIRTAIREGLLLVGRAMARVIEENKISDSILLKFRFFDQLKSKNPDEVIKSLLGDITHEDFEITLAKKVMSDSPAVQLVRLPLSAF